MVKRANPEFPDLQIGTRVVALVRIAEELPDGSEHVHAVPGAVGYVVARDPDCLPTIQWAQSVYDCDPRSEIRIDALELCG